ncbi:CheA signal transduction histidine kinase [Crenobacter luteus]|uniref:chemotaxis protein CheW n=1 Tax=Crenobacter luteus TaxID=1452487 RepID=UPI0010CED46F|nr:chemotaxis protein CheW [Crenobacter luteus]TCP12612.1 CheA signal transduction histidine kinase [Crenobacter luteus]
MSQFHQVFFDEAEEHLAAMESLLLAVDLAAPDAEDLNAIFRAAHSIKGGAATFGFADLADFTHVMENLLDRVRRGELALTAAMVDVCLESKDALKTLLTAHRGGPEAEAAWVADLRSRLSALSRGDAVAPAAVEADPFVAHTARPPSCDEPGVLHTLYVEIDATAAVDMPALLDKLGRLGTVSLAREGSADAPWLLVFTSELAETELAETLAFAVAPGLYRVLDGRVEEDDGFGLFLSAPAGEPAATVASEDEGFGLFAPLPAPTAPPASAGYEEDGFGLFAPLPAESSPPDAAAVPGPAPSAAPASVSPGGRERAAPAAAVENSLRVSTEKVDTLLNLVGELVITQSMLQQYGSELDPVLHERLLNGIAQLERNSRELQEAVMSIRMTPVASVFNRFPRVVRDLAAKLDKEVELKMVGEHTELDKGFVEKLSDPLTHLVRNSLDHGIEPPEVRRAKGKAPVGRLTLRAFHQGGSIVIEVNDDGAGLDRERILAKARERGMTVSDSMSDAEVWSLIFEAGFSTAAEVTDVSGRGVGMDVVRKNIHAMGGRIEIDSLPDYGTTMRIRLPLTLAILDGMSVRVGRDTFVLPLGFVLESLQPAAADVRSVAGRGRVVNMRGDYVPIVTLSGFFGDIDGAMSEPSEGILIIVESEGIRAAVLVDELVGQQQFVVKNLETNYRKVGGLSGATILGDGQVALILDVAAIVRSGLREGAQAASLTA